MQFAVETMRPDGTTVTEHVEASDRSQAVEAVREKGLLVLGLREAAETGAAARAAAPRRAGGRINTRDLILFTRQMTMLLEAGTPVVPALEAAEQQTAKPAMAAVLRRLRERVEEGESLSAALDAERQAFDPVFRSMIAAGEATASLPQVFARLCSLAQQRQQTRKLVLGALLYPALLSVLLVGVIAVLLLFVVPRFKMLFDNLRSPLPATTRMLFEASQHLVASWPYVLGALVLLAGGAVLCFRLPRTRTWIDYAVLRLPVVGPVVGRLIFARVVRVWAAMLRCHVPLLETIQQSREAIRNAAFLRLLEHVEQTVSSGGRMAQAISSAGLADPMVVAAIRTGEENGRLAEAADFVSDWMDEDNTATIQHLTRLAEPVLLAVMGVVVGTVAMALFLPLFDMATAG